MIHKVDKVFTKHTYKLQDCENNVNYMGCQDKACNIKGIIKCIKIIHYLKVR